MGSRDLVQFAVNLASILGQHSFSQGLSSFFSPAAPFRCWLSTILHSTIRQQFQVQLHALEICAFGSSYCAAFEISFIDPEYVFSSFNSPHYPSVSCPRVDGSA